jgi:hypothetical protein
MACGSKGSSTVPSQAAISCSVMVCDPLRVANDIPRRPSRDDLMRTLGVISLVPEEIGIG